MIMDRSPGAGAEAEAEAEMWHSQETTHDRLHTDSNGVLAWYWESVNLNPTLTFPTQLNAAQRCRGIPPREPGGGCQVGTSWIIQTRFGRPPRW